MWIQWLVCVCVLGALAQDEERESRLVTTKQGKVRGYKNAEYDIFVFYGIPYAKAPVGTEKFKAPLPPPVWLQPLEAVDDSIICPQIMFPAFDYTKQTVKDNCLVANIYVPDTKETKLPVVVYVHGGGFIVGYGNLGAPKSLVSSKKVIAVTFNYRLAIHGFLCLGTRDVPGNAGMKDQVALLRWVQRNIAGFGGDPSDVTIAGYSAGSSSVDLLMLSKMTKGLFHKVIPESGANLGSLPVQVNPIANAKHIANHLNATDVDNVYALEEFYQNVDVASIPFESLMSNTDSSFVFTPCVERETGEEMFLDDSPYNILKKGKYPKVPMLYGFADKEGLFREPLFNNWAPRMNENFADFLPVDLQFENDKQKEQIAQQIKEFYFGDKPVQDNILKYIDYYTDVIFGFPTLWSAKLQVAAGNNRVYLYEYSFVDDDAPLIPNTNVRRGADHCAQTGAVLEIAIGITQNVSESFNQMKKTMKEIWLNFITTGEPVPKGSSLPAWPPVGSGWGPHMSLGNTIELRGPLLETRAKFWEAIYDKYYAMPSPPPPPPKTEL